MRGRILILGLLVVSLSPVAHVATAQSYPPEVAASCAQFGGDVQTINGQLAVLYRGRLTTFGPAGCAQPGETVASTVFSAPFVLGRTTSAADGSWSISGRLPASVLPGAHQVVSDFGPGRAQVVHAIVVVATFAAAAAATARGSSVSPVTLPRTGTDIALLVAWALALIAAGALLTRYARSRLRAHSVHRRARHGAHHPTSVPRIDTEGFTPVRAAHRATDPDG